MSGLDAALAVAQKIALEAGVRVATYRQQLETLSVDYKSAGDPVTNADREANETIVSGLKSAFPQDAMLAEETPDDGHWIGRERVWMVDPIDGTKDFIAGRDGFATMIGLAVQGRPMLGVVYQPMTGRMYSGIVGVGAWRSEHGTSPAAQALQMSQSAMTVGTVAKPEDIRLVASKSHRTTVIDHVRASLGIRDEMNIGSVGLKMGLIAAGERDLYINPSGRSCLWDTCGPEAILTAAGGRVTDLDGNPLIYNRLELHNLRGIVASNGRVHDLVLTRLAAPGDALR